MTDEEREQNRRERNVVQREELPDWTQGLNDVQQLLQGLTFTLSACIHAKGETIEANSPIRQQNHVDEFKKMDQKTAMLEVVCGVLITWLAHHSSSMPPAIFNSIVSPLGETLAGSLAQIGVIKVAEKDITMKVCEKIKAVHESKATAKGIDSFVNEKAMKEMSEFDESALESAVEKLKRIGKGLLH